MKVPNDRWELGRVSEELVAKHLERQGYAIVTRNFNAPGGELDILCTKEDVLFVVEVRSRKYGVRRPINTIGPAKQRHIFDATDVFMSQYKPDVSEVRFIVAEVEWHGDSPLIQLTFDPFISYDRAD